MRIRSMFWIAAAAAIAACSGPEESPFDIAARETPVALEAGLYELRLGGATVVQLKSGSRTDEICLNSYDAAQILSNPLAKMLPPWENCVDEMETPRGNTLTGERRCEKRKTPMTASYSGTHTADSFQIQGMVKQGSDESASIMRLGSGDFSISGRRVGACSY
jgi:Protein of unknown function (DUF3617)